MKHAIDAQVNGSKQRKNTKTGQRTTSAVVQAENIHFQKSLQGTITDGIGDMVGQARTYKNNPVSSRTGYVIEANHCATFNVENALKRSDIKAVREPNGTHGDYKIVRRGKVLKEGEVKYYATAEKTENALRGYGEKQRLAPSDQVDEIKNIAGKKAAKGKVSDKPARQKVGKEHESVASNTTDAISDGTCPFGKHA